MLSDENLLNILIGGDYTGDTSWSRRRNSSDNCFKAYYVYSGNVVIYDHKEHILEAGKIYLINGYRMDGFRSYGSFSVGWLHFIPKSMTIYKSLTSLPIVSEVSTSANSELSELLRNVDTIIAPSDSLTPRYIKLEALLLYAISELLDKHGMNLPLSGNRNNMFWPVLEYIRMNLHEDMTLAMLADKCHLSKSHFIRQFTNEYMITPMNFVFQCKMNQARELLLLTRLPIKEIGFRLGFEDQAYFSRVFRKYYSVSPSELRRKPQHILF